MSLQVWLPLTGSLENQGLSEVEVTNTNAVVNVNGKIGSCYSFGTGTSYLTVDHTPLQSFSEFSFACWVKIISWNTNYATIFAAKNGTGVSWNNLIFSLLRTSSNSTLCFNISNGTNYTTTNCQTGALSLDTWYHIVCTYKSGNIKLYQDGVEVSSYDTSVIPNFSSIANLWIGRSNASNYQSNVLLSDVRIYDECLNPLEIKRISQGLVLHYPLNDPYIESTTNLIITEDCLSSTCYNAATSKYGYGTNTDMYKEVTVFDGKTGTKVYMGTDGLSAYPYVYVNDMYTSDGTNSPQYKTLSFDYYTTISTSICPYKLGNGSGTATYTVINSTTKTGTGTNSVTIPVEPNMWNHIEITFCGTTSDDAQWGYIQNRPSHTSDTSNFWFFANMQLEAKDHATPYAGVGGSRTNDYTIYDASGFNNNGIIYRYDDKSTIATLTDTPRYTSSTLVRSAAVTHAGPGTAYIAGDVSLVTPQQLSICFWVNPISAGYGNSYGQGIFCTTAGTNTGTDYLTSAMNQYDSGVSFNSSDGSTRMRPSFVISEGWHHYAATYDGQTARLYKDGVQTATQSFSTAQTLGPFDHVFFGFSKAGGVWRRNMCKWSDCRVYATALSADDIKALYQNSGYISSNKVTYTYEFVEE